MHIRSTAYGGHAHEQVLDLRIPQLHLQSDPETTATAAPPGDAVTIALTLLAVARVTRFITSDMLFETPRGWAVRRLIEHKGQSSSLRGTLAYLIVCDWCASVYVGAAAAGAWCVWGETMPFMMVALALAASYVTGFLSSLTDRGE